jgi:trigger factor
LKFTKEILEDQQARLIVELEPSSLDEYKTKAGRRISSKTKIAGFRPGKAPIDVVKRLYGDEVIEEEAIELMVNDIYPKLLKEAEINPAAPGKLEKIESKNPPKFIFIAPLEPYVKLGDYGAIRMDYVKQDVSNEDIENVLHQLQLNYSTATPVEREAQVGDLVDIKITAKLINPDESEKPDVLKDSPYQVILGESNDNKEEKFPFNGFEELIIGLKKSDEKLFTHKYPDSSSFEKLKGKDVEFTITIQSIRELNKPELNDEFAKSYSNEKTIADFREAIKKDLTASKQHEYDHKFMDEIIDKVISISKIHYPPQVLEEEKERVLENFKQNLASQNLDLDTYLKMNQIDKEKFIEEEIKSAAKHQLEQYLVLEQIRKDEKIELEKEALQEEYSRSFSEIQSTADIQKLRRQFTTKGLANRVLLQVANRLMNRRVESRLMEIATGKAKEKKEKVEEASSTDKKADSKNRGQNDKKRI